MEARIMLVSDCPAKNYDQILEGTAAYGLILQSPIRRESSRISDYLLAAPQGLVMESLAGSPRLVDGFAFVVNNHNFSEVEFTNSALDS